MHLRADFIVGTQTSNSWSGVYGFKPEDSIEPLELFAIIKLESLTSEDRLEALAKMFLDELQNYLFNEGKEGNYIIRLENAVWKMKSKMELLLSSDERYSQNGLDIEIALTLFDKNFLYLGVIGESKIFIKREDKFVELSQGLSDANMMGFLKTGSLELEEGDRLVLATNTAAEQGLGSIEPSVNNLNIQALSSLTSEKGTAVLLLADEKDNWTEKEIIDEEFIPETPINLEFDDNPHQESAKFIPIQEEDFEDNLEAVVTESKEEELNLQALENKFIPLEKEEVVLNTNKTELSENELPKGRVLLNSVGSKLSSGMKMGASRLNDLRTRMQRVQLENTEEFSNDIDNPAEVKESKVSSAFLKTAPILESFKSFVENKLIPFFKKSNKTYIKYLRDFVLLIAGLIKKLLAWFKKEFIGGGVDDRRNIFEKAKKRKRNRIILIVFVVILAVLIVSAINNRNAQLREQQRIDTARSNVDQYKSELDNLVRQTNTNLNDTQKNTVIDQLDKLNTSLETQKRQDLFIDEIANYQTTITKTKDKVLGVVGFTDSQMVADIGKIYSDANLIDMVYTDGNLYVGDKARNTIYQVGTNINSQVSQFATGLNAPYTMTVNAAGDIIFFDSDSTSAVGRIFVGGNGRIERYPGLAPAVIGTVTKSAVFSGNDALYELHQNHQQIYKREKAGEDYTSGGAVYNTQNPPNWKTDPELGSAIDIDIPYEIYVLIRGKGLRRYLAGEANTISKETFVNTSQKDIDSLASATAFDIDGKLLAVADPTNRRVLLFRIEDNDAKTLAYEKSYVYRGNDSTTFKNIKEIVVNESSKYIFVLDGTGIIRLDI